MNLTRRPPTTDEVRQYLREHDLYAVSRPILERIVELDGCHIIDDSDRLFVIVRRKDAS